MCVVGCSCAYGGQIDPDLETGASLILFHHLTPIESIEFAGREFNRVSGCPFAVCRLLCLSEMVRWVYN
jgi:hypothetical protein